MFYITIDDGKYICLFGMNIQSSNVSIMACPSPFIKNLAVADDGTVYAIIYEWPSKNTSFVTLDHKTGAVTETIIPNFDKTIGAELSATALIINNSYYCLTTDADSHINRALKVDITAKEFRFSAPLDGDPPHHFAAVLV